MTVELKEGLELTGRINPSEVFHVPPDRPQEPEERGEDHERQRGVEHELHVSAPSGTKHRIISTAISPSISECLKNRANPAERVELREGLTR
jgi:hypothetical protein